MNKTKYFLLLAILLLSLTLSVGFSVWIIAAQTTFVPEYVDDLAAVTPAATAQGNQQSYTVSYDNSSNPAVDCIASVTVIVSQNENGTRTVESGFTPVNLNAAEKSAAGGKLFVGWFTQTDGSGLQITDEASLLAVLGEQRDITLYAYWVDPS